MGVDLAIYRARIGVFVMPRKCKIKLDTIVLSRSSVSMTLRLVIFWSVLVTLGGDIELNPGPPRNQRQRTISFAEAAATSPPGD